MKNKTKFAFLSLALVSSMIFAACNKPAETTKSTEAPQSTEPASTSQPSSDPTTAKPSSSSSSTPSSSTSSTPSTSVPSSSSSSSSTPAAPTVVSIAVNLDNVKTAYTRGEALDLTGIVVTGTFSDGTSRAVHSYTPNPANGTVLDQVGEKDIVVTYKEVTTSFKVTVANKKFTVKFVANGQELQTGEVEEGQTATYSGETPTKAADANAVKYRFKGWDKDLSQPITADNTFNALFAEYAAEVVVDDFESYESSSEVTDADWVAIGWKDNGWSEETNAAVSLGTNSVEGNKALRLDAWRNGSYYKMAKKFQTNTFNKSVNAMKFRLMVPADCDIQVILYAACVINGEQQSPAFYYPLKAQSSEYVEYTLPLDDAAWDLWNQHKGQSIAAVADWTGIHQDDFMSYLTKIEIAIKGSVDGNLPYHGYLDSLKFVTLDNPAKAEVERMGQYTKYTGVLNNGYTVKVELGANGAATATVLDAPQQQQIPGTVAIDANKNMTFTSADSGATLVYKAQLKNGGQSLKFVEAGGALADAVTGVNLNAVQVVDNYEQYATDGQAYCLKYPDINARSGARGAYYSEYCAGGSASAPWGGATWSLLGSDGEQLKLKQDQAGAHSGNNYLCLKHSKSVAFRYMQWGLFDGTADRNNFRGSKLSFWAKTKDLVNKFKVYMYSQPNPRLSTMENEVKIGVFEQAEAISQWKHFEIDLNPNLTYYGFMITMDKNTTLPTNEAYLYIDDVEVYTADPYATYVPEVPPVEDRVLTPGMTYIGKVAGLINAQLTIGQDNAVTLAAPGMAMNVNGTYAIAGDEVTMTLGDVQYVGTIEDNAINFKSINGTGTIAGALTNLNFNMIEYADNAETYESDGKMYYQGNTDVNAISGARGAYHCDYYTGGTSNLSPIGGNGWSLMGGKGDQLSLDKTTAADGSQSLLMKYSSAGNMRYLQWGLADGTAVGHKGFNKFGIYLKNTNANAVSIKLYAYHIQKVEPSTQGDSSRKSVELTIPANSDWTLYTLDLDAAKTYYGYGIYMVTKSSTGYLNVDKAFYYNDYESPEMNYFAKEGLALNGTITAGAATMTFGQDGAVTLHNDMLGGDLAGTYTMAMGEDGQLLTVKTSMGNITGTYSVNPMGKVTFTVTEVTGGLAQGVNVGAVLSNQ